VVMGFIVWMWWDSQRAGTYAGDHPRLMLANARSTVKIYHEDAGGVAEDWGIIRDDLLGDPMDRIEMNLELPRVDSVETLYGKRITLTVPHVWLLIPAAVLWMALLGWRWRRIRRAKGLVEGGEG
jgi:hypothetical protein